MLDLRRFSNPSSRTDMRHAGENSKPQVANQNIAVWINMNQNHACDITRFSWLFLTICYIIFYTFTKMNHRMTFNAFPVDVQGGRKCRNRHVAETTAIHFQQGFQVGTCNMHRKELYHCDVAFISQTLPQHRRSSSRRFWSATSGSSDSLQHKVQIIPKKNICFCSQHNFKFHFISFLILLSQIFSRIHPLGILECVKASGSIVEPEFDRSARTGGKGGRPAFDNTSQRDPCHTSHVLLRRSVDFSCCYLLAIFPRNFAAGILWWFVKIWIPHCWEARFSNSQNQSTKPCRRGQWPGRGGLNATPWGITPVGGLNAMPCRDKTQANLILPCYATITVYIIIYLEYW